MTASIGSRARLTGSLNPERRDVSGITPSQSQRIGFVERSSEGWLAWAVDIQQSGPPDPGMGIETVTIGGTRYKTHGRRYYRTQKRAVRAVRREMEKRQQAEAGMTNRFWVSS